ncbi:MAG: cell division protein ZapA [Prevotellaceae bacterium]|nr:cell division protein ZapA [Prevotellaceae bacterium]
MANDKMVIKLLIGRQIYPINVRPEQEGLFREAARQINERLASYQTQWIGQDTERCLIATTLDFTVRMLRALEDASCEPYAASIGQLTAEVEEALAENTGTNTTQTT